MVAVDRDRPYEFEYRNVKARVHFRWGSDNNPIPVSIYVMVDGSEPIIGSREKAVYSSFEEAKERGIQIAKVDIDRILGPDPER
ncbi:hypothetical protein WDV92_10525 [Pseudomonas syringae pv. atrofaciens]|uniref:hypothetical protein n=1 Tax=Pseudomonas syringae TaxID=317 RepID=UPI001F0E48DC|nr:hypothetical protein [Pseudomonas syringae]MCH5486773.1 hypothetical protein [Pseudomonas syringae pv. syringae]MDO1457653.1 hypothetical protein [Pseudomonas syringae pv. syringae]